MYQQSFGISYTLEGGYPLDQSPFVFTIPYVAGTAKIIVKHNTVSLAQKSVSPNAPTVSVATPNGGEQLSDQVTIHWSGNDADGDTLAYAVLFSPDNGTTWETLAANLSATSYVWDVSQAPTGTQYLVKVIATDGINTGQDVSDAPFAVVATQKLYLPLVLRN